MTSNSAELRKDMAKVSPYASGQQNDGTDKCRSHIPLISLPDIPGIWRKISYILQYYPPHDVDIVDNENLRISLVLRKIVSGVSTKILSGDG